MSSILSETRCTSCGEKLVKNPFCGGDYYNTVTGYCLQEYCDKDCKQNGILNPLIEGHDPDFISNRGKESFGVKTAIENNLGIIETKKIAKSCETNNFSEFIIIFSRKLHLPRLEINFF